jgi:predicted ArsR family transcriptional regulator
MKRWSNRFLASTRGKVVQLLRRGSASVNELAEALELTDNAIRSHLNTLERDGLVAPSGKRPAVRKPETLYALTPDADQLFPQAYHLLLNRLLDAVARRMAPEEIERMLREVGRDLGTARGPSPPDATLRERVEKATEVLKGLGGLADIEENGGIMIQGYSCPLSAAVEHHPDFCKVAESLLSEVIQAPVHEMCDRSGPPRCAFRVEKTTP